MSQELKIIFTPVSPFHFDGSLHKPSHFPSSDNVWEEGNYWITMLWQGKKLGIHLINKGTIEKPEIEIDIYSNEKLSEEYLASLKPELEWRFNLKSDLSESTEKFKDDKILGPILKKWAGVRPVAANSLYETLVIYIVLQNATVRRSVQMLEALFEKYGSKMTFADKTLSTFWDPSVIAKVDEQELRDLKLGYRAKFLKRISEQFANGEIDEFAMRAMTNDDIRQNVLKLYGIGPASVEYLLFEDFYRYDAFSTIPPWEQKILSRLFYNKELVLVEKLLSYAERWGKYKKLAVHLIWEDLFWRHKNEPIDWLAKEIRL